MKGYVFLQVFLERCTPEAHDAKAAHLNTRIGPVELLVVDTSYDPHCWHSASYRARCHGFAVPSDPRVDRDGTVAVEHIAAGEHSCGLRVYRERRHVAEHRRWIAVLPDTAAMFVGRVEAGIVSDRSCGRRLRRGVRAARAELLSLTPIFVHPDPSVPGPWDSLPATYADIARALQAHYGVPVARQVPASVV